MPKLFEGSGVALVTPFKESKKGNIIVDYDALERLVDFHVNNNTDAIIICGTTGEASTLTDAEHLKTIGKCVEYVNGRIPVIAGTGSNNTAHAVLLSKKAEDLGVDGLLCVTPYYNKTNQEGLKLYYKRIADAVSVPIIMYNVPSRTGVNILPETAISIAQNNPNVVAIKEASGKLDQVAAITESKALDVYSGNDDQIYDVMDAGGLGVISVLANVFPQETHDMVYEYLKGNKKISLQMQKEALALVKDLFCDVNPIPVKRAVAIKGLCSDLLREPLVPLDDEKTQRLTLTMKEYETRRK